MNNPPVSSFKSFLRMTALGAVTVASVAVADTVGLSGSVSTTASVVSGATGSATALNMGGVGTDLAEQIVHVADVTLATNNVTGLTVTITSGNLANAGTLVPYKVLTVADGAGAPASAAFTTASGTNYTYSTAGAADPKNELRDLYIAYDPPVQLDPGTYSATITLTVLDN